MENELFVCSKYGSQRPLLATVVVKLYYNGRGRTGELTGLILIK